MHRVLKSLTRVYPRNTYHLSNLTTYCVELLVVLPVVHFCKVRLFVEEAEEEEQQQQQQHACVRVCVYVRACVRFTSQWTIFQWCGCLIVADNARVSSDAYNNAQCCRHNTQVHHSYNHSTPYWASSEKTIFFSAFGIVTWSNSRPPNCYVNAATKAAEYHNNVLLEYFWIHIWFRFIKFSVKWFV